MCGIVGLFCKTPKLQDDLGAHLSDMLVIMSDRGPDSAGIAIYDAPPKGAIKLTVQSEDGFDTLAATLSEVLDHTPQIEVKSTHAVVTLPREAAAKVRPMLRAQGYRVMSTGERIEIYKEVGLPGDVAARFDIPTRRGSHGIGHTRMATESAVTTQGAHPFSTGPDQCLVHNGSLSNHNSLRRRLSSEGVEVETENDTEVAAAYLTWRMKQGASLGEALQAGIKDLDGFYTFVVGTADGFGVLRDPIACKPAVLAETEDYVAFGSEYRALVNLPGIESARVWEPEPAQVYFWSH